MNSSQRAVIAGTAYVIAAVLFTGYFLMPFWSWATWKEKEGTLDLGLVKITNRPPFPRNARGMGLGVLVPVVLVAAGRVFALGGRDEVDER